MVVSGLSRLLQLDESSGLHLGTGAAVIPKYLRHKYPSLRQILVDKSKSVLINCAKFFEWPEENDSFRCINIDAESFIMKEKETNNKHNFILVDINGEDD